MGLAVAAVSAEVGGVCGSGAVVIGSSGFSGRTRPGRRSSGPHADVRTGRGHREEAPLDRRLTGGNRNDVTQLIPLLKAVPPVRGKRGRPRRRPDVLLADRGYDHDKYRRLVWALGVKPLIARRGTEHGSGLGAQRWVVERAFAHLHWFRRLRIRWEIRDDIHEAFLTLGCSIICWRRLKNHHA
ncbi:IS5 family transposase [Streptomyces tremellae]|uniref:IS5 family transposase n=1 Tax=Streptomyces tremellae TaxID=1124239 RepID=A0ABP7GBX4_9ACTN